MSSAAFFRRPWWRDRLGAAQLHLVVRMALLAILALLCARLFWVAVTPLGPLGNWQPAAPAIPSPAVRSVLLGGMDPFGGNRAAPGQSNVVTSLDLELFGIRQNLGAGTGGAIIARPDGVQVSIGVGEEIVPGAILSAVAFDHVLIDRGGIEERLYLDESAPTTFVAPDGGTATTPAAALSADSIDQAVRFSPRMRGNAVTGITVAPGANQALWAQTGLQPGDVVVQVNGVSVTSASDLEQLRREIRPGARISLGVERGANVLPIVVNIPQ